jgi:DNA invertase Pin-like site-specific DNA recombinase
MRETKGEAMKAIIYLRVSTDEQGVSGLGLEAQEATARDYCSRQGFEVVEIVREIQSGKTTKKRPLLTTALDRCRKGEAGILIASNVSRLSRSIGDLAAMLEEAEKRGYNVAALDTGLDTTTPAGKMVFQILGVAAEYERAMIADRTKKALAAKKARGEKIGRTSTLELVAVKMIQTYRTEGHTFAAIADELNALGVATGQGGAKWYPSTVRKVLLANGGEVLEVMPRPGRKAA